jgi:hypothetical protein
VATVKVEGAGSMKVAREWTFRIDDEGALRAQMGPLGAYIGSDEITKAIKRALKVRPLLAGVTWYEEDTVQSRTSRIK